MHNKNDNNIIWGIIGNVPLLYLFRCSYSVVFSCINYFLLAYWLFRLMVQYLWKKKLKNFINIVIILFFSMHSTYHTNTWLLGTQSWRGVRALFIFNTRSVSKRKRHFSTFSKTHKNRFQGLFYALRDSSDIRSIPLNRIWGKVGTRVAKLTHRIYEWKRIFLLME